jgi:dTDP-L-rhamnose 4-epimerase
VYRFVQAGRRHRNHCDKNGGISLRVLVTGGAGFIGTHLTRRLLLEGCAVSVLDNFSSQVHAGAQELAPDLIGSVQLFRGDVRDLELVSRALDKQDVVVHLAAETGTGQSMYEVMRYQDVNIGGTAAIMNSLVNSSKSRVSKVVVASSRAIYGEGKYRCGEHGVVYPGGRRLEDLQARQYEPCCPVCKAPCDPEATSEDAPNRSLSFYGLTKQVQEEMVLMFARTCGFSAYALRYQNVYGPGQSLQNPYTGILAIFSNLARSNSPIQIFEDGQESRDFVFVEDAVEATWRCIEGQSSSVQSFNVGTGKRISVLQVAKEIVEYFGSSSKISITGAFRQGDIRHNFADLSKVREAIDFTPRFTFVEGLQQFLAWAAGQDRSSAGYESSLLEMRERGLLHG